MRNWYNELSTIDVSEHVEKKNGLSYLSWMWAWNELKQRFPLSFATVYEREDGSLVWPDPVGAHVKTSVTIVWEEEDGFHNHMVYEYLPVMDFRNKSVPFDACDSMTVNKTIQRSLTKCIARLGLGAYIYAGEDLPMESIEVKEQKANEAGKINELIGTVESLLKEKCKGWNADKKRELNETVIIPTLEVPQYKQCKDVDKLEELIEKLKAI